MGSVYACAHAEDLATFFCHKYSVLSSLQSIQSSRKQYFCLSSSNMQAQRKEIFLILLLSVPLSDAFWLTDLSLFQPPFLLGQNLSVKSQADYQPAVELSNETPANWASVGSDLKTQIRQVSSANQIRRQKSRFLRSRQIERF